MAAMRRKYGKKMRKSPLAGDRVVQTFARKRALTRRVGAGR